MLTSPNRDLEASRERAQEMIERGEAYVTLEELARVIQRGTLGQVAAWHLNRAYEAETRYYYDAKWIDDWGGGYWKGIYSAHLDSADHFANLGRE